MTSERIPDISGRVPRRAAEWRQEATRITVVKQRTGAVRRRALRLFGIPSEFKVHLDPLGSEVWLLMDGHRSVAAIKVMLQQKFPDETNMAPRLGQFFSLMVSKGLVVLD